MSTQNSFLLLWILFHLLYIVNCLYHHTKMTELQNKENVTTDIRELTFNCWLVCYFGELTNSILIQHKKVYQYCCCLSWNYGNNFKMVKFPPVPQEVKPIAHLLKIADEHESRNIVVTYWGNKIWFWLLITSCFVAFLKQSR